MSVITNLIVSASLYSEDVERVQVVLNDVIGNSIPFLLVDRHKVGGSKVLRTELFIASINNLDKEKFVTAIKNLKNIIDEDSFKAMQIFVLGEDDILWNIFLASEFTTECL